MQTIASSPACLPRHSGAHSTAVCATCPREIRHCNLIFTSLACRRIVSSIGKEPSAREAFDQLELMYDLAALIGDLFLRSARSPGHIS